jgi:hypothetical protein
MVARALGVSFRQALRSVALTLFPLAFISLFTWASAGSTGGSTADPVRASAWLYLGAHLIPFSVPHGKVTLLPLLAVLYPMWAIRRGLPRVEGAFTKLNGARIVYALWYALLSELLALASIYHGVIANLYLTLIFTFIVAMLATTDFKRPKMRALNFALYLSLVAMGIGSLAFALSLLGHLSQIKSISVVLGTGVVGGILLLLLQLLYLPNISLAAISYLTGANFSFGSHSMISGGAIRVGEIPALPFAAALPTGLHPEVKYGVILWVLAFGAVVLFAERGSDSISSSTQKVTVVGLQFFLVLAPVAFLSTGELFVATLNPVGIFWWRFVAHLAVAFVAAAILALYLPATVRKLVRRG